MTCISFFILAVLIILCEFIDRIICQVHIRVVDIGATRFLIWLRTKSSESHLMQVNPQWVDSIQEHVDSQIILQILHKVWPINILLNYVACTLLVNVATLSVDHGLLEDVIYIF